MKIAVTYENGQIFQHFGHTEKFKVYQVEDGKVVSSAILSANGVGHGALAGLLRDSGADTLICGGIGGGAQMALAQAGIRLYGGVSGSADQAVEDLLAGKLDYDPDVKCDHHDHAHGEGHQCGHHHGGDHGCGGRHGGGHSCCCGPGGPEFSHEKRPQALTHPCGYNKIDADLRKRRQRRVPRGPGGRERTDGASPPQGAAGRPSGARGGNAPPGVPVTDERARLRARIQVGPRTLESSS